MISRYLLPLVCAALLSGCLGNEPEDTSLSAASNFFNPEAFVPPPRFTNLFAEPRPILDIEFVDLGVAGKLILEQQDGPYSRYLSSDLGGIVLQRGMLHSLFGFGEPLAAANLSGPLPLILGGNEGSADRFHTYLNGENRAVSRTYRCSIAVVGPREVILETGTVQTTLMSEDCQSLNQSFQNLYWVERGRGEVIQSKQWAGDNVGSIVTRVTYP
jgi:hypothetical protein